MGLYSFGKSSNKSTRNFYILVKLKSVRTILYFKQRYCIIEVISPNIIMIYQFPECVSQYKDRYPHSVKSEVKKAFKSLESRKNMENAVFSAKVWFVQLRYLFLQ